MVGVSYSIYKPGSIGPGAAFALDQLRQLLAGLHLVQLPLYLL